MGEAVEFERRFLKRQDVWAEVSNVEVGEMPGVKQYRTEVVFRRRLVGQLS